MSSQYLFTWLNWILCPAKKTQAFSLYIYTYFKISVRKRGTANKASCNSIKTAPRPSFGFRPTSWETLYELSSVVAFGLKEEDVSVPTDGELQCLVRALDQRDGLLPESRQLHLVDGDDLIPHQQGLLRHVRLAASLHLHTDEPKKIKAFTNMQFPNLCNTAMQTCWVTHSAAGAIRVPIVPVGGEHLPRCFHVRVMQRVNAGKHWRLWRRARKFLVCLYL